jgi:hypothetical protein
MRVEQGLNAVLTELREMSRGIHPAILTKAGLGPALRTLARRSALPVELQLHTERRLPDHVEVAAYYAASEALTNTAKHAHTSVVNIDLVEPNAILKLAIRDDGVGGADPSQRTGLVGPCRSYRSPRREPRDCQPSDRRNLAFNRDSCRRADCHGFPRTVATDSAFPPAFRQNWMLLGQADRR